VKTKILLITGPAGIGKSTLCWELGSLLSAARISHAIIETDELDRVYPRPTAQDLAPISAGASDVSAINLAAIWSTYRALGHTRLIMSGVMLHLGLDRRWILSAIPDAEITAIRLQATELTLLDRLGQREVGSGRDEQVERTLRQARRMAAETSGEVRTIQADSKTPTELAEQILRDLGWANTTDAGR
jgi:predicted kinase